MEFQEAIDIIKKYNNPEIDEALRWITPAEFKSNHYKECFENIVKTYKDMLKEINKNKIIILGRPCWATEWSWNPCCDGRGVYEEVMREHAIINGIDCYFTNKNNRVYFKEHLFENKEDAKKACSWQNSFGYDYENIVSRERDIMEFIRFNNGHWRYK
jgi:hypothetical protein